MIYREIQRKVMRVKDERIKVTNEVFGGVKIIKLYAWYAFVVCIDRAAATVRGVCVYVCMGGGASGVRGHTDGV